MYGMPHSFGKLVLVTSFSIPDLVTYFPYISAQFGGNLPCEIKGVSISFNATENMDLDKSCAIPFNIYTPCSRDFLF